MSIKTQIKTAQLTGSMPASNRSAVSSVEYDSNNNGNLQDVLDHMASAIKRIHGGTSFSSSAAGEFAAAIKSDTIQEKTGNAGVTIEGVLLKDNDIVIPNAATIGSVGDPDAMAISAGGDVSFTQDILMADAKTIGSATTTDLVTINANDVKIKAGKDLLVDEILESTADGGVTIDGAKIKDGSLIIADGGNIGSASDVDAIAISSGGDVTLSQDLKFADGKLLGSTTTADLLTINANDVTVKTGKSLILETITELGSAGVTIEGVKLKDNDIVIPDGSTIGTATTADAMTIASDGIVTFKDDIKIKDGGTIGSASGPTAMTIDASGNVTFAANVTVSGTTTQVDTTNLQVKDKNILINDGGGANSATGAGLDFEEDGSVTGYIRVADDDRTNLDLKAPGGSELKLDINSGVTWTVGGALTVEGTSALNQDLTTDATPTFGAAVISGGGNGIRFNDNDQSNYVQLQAPSEVGSNIILTLPNTDGDNGNSLLTDGNGALSWGSPAAGSVAADDISVGDDVVNIKTNTSGKHINIQAENNSMIGLTGSMGISLNPGLGMAGNGPILFIRSTDSSYNGNEAGRIELKNFGDGDERLLIQAEDIMHLSASDGHFVFHGESQYGLGQPFFQVFSGSTGQTILSASVHNQPLVIRGNNAAEHFRVHASNGVSIPASKTFSFNGDTNTMKISANNGNNMNINAPGDVIINAGGGNVSPSAADGAALGAADAEWSDLFLADAAVINLGNDQDVTLTHVADTGLLLNSSRELQFGDSGTRIYQPMDGRLKLDSDGVTEVSATTSIQMDSPIVDFEDDGVVLQFGDGDDVSLTHVHNTGLQISGVNRLLFGSTAAYMCHDGTDLELVDDADINIKPAVDFLVDAGGDVILDSAQGEWEFKKGGTEVFVIGESNTGDVTLETDTQDKDMIFKVNDGGTATEVARVIGASSELRMASGKKLTFADAGEYISGDGTNLTLGSGGMINMLSPVSMAANGLVMADNGGSAPSTPGSGFGVFYVQSDTPYFKSDAGTVYNLTQASTTGSHPTKVQYTVTGTHAADRSLLINSGALDYQNWIDAGGHGGNTAPGFLDVFVNGQLLVSGGHGSLSGADYVLEQGGSNNKIKFAFGLENGDVVTVKRIRQA